MAAREEAKKRRSPPIKAGPIVIVANPDAGRAALESMRQPVAPYARPENPIDLTGAGLSMMRGAKEFTRGIWDPTQAQDETNAGHAVRSILAAPVSAALGGLQATNQAGLASRQWLGQEATNIASDFRRANQTPADAAREQALLSRMGGILANPPGMPAAQAGGTISFLDALRNMSAGEAGGYAGMDSRMAGMMNIPSAGGALRGAASEIEAIGRMATAPTTVRANSPQYPDAQPVARADWSKVDEALNAAAPKPITDETKMEMEWGGYFSGLAEAAMTVGEDAGVGQLLFKMGMGAIAGRARASRDVQELMQKHEERMSRWQLQKASLEQDKVQTTAQENRIIEERQRDVLVNRWKESQPVIQNGRLIATNRIDGNTVEITSQAIDNSAMADYLVKAATLRAQAGQADVEAATARARVAASVIGATAADQTGDPLPAAMAHVGNLVDSGEIWGLLSEQERLRIQAAALRQAANWQRARTGNGAIPVDDTKNPNAMADKVGAATRSIVFQYVMQRPTLSGQVFDYDPTNPKARPRIPAIEPDRRTISINAKGQPSVSQTFIRKER